jgi:hypothetical protein
MMESPHMRYVRLAAITMATLMLTGCGMADARRQLAESHARLEAAIMADVRAGRLTPEQAEDELDDVGAMEAEATAPVQSVTYTPAPVMPVFQPSAAHSPPPQPYIGPAPASVSNYTSNPPPAAQNPRFIPYQAVAPLMPGISASGTAK